MTTTATTTEKLTKTPATTLATRTKKLTTITRLPTTFATTNNTGNNNLIYASHWKHSWDFTKPSSSCFRRASVTQRNLMTSPKYSSPGVFSSKPTYTSPSNGNASPSKSLSEKHSSQRSPQLSVTGFRSDVYNVNSSSSSTTTKPMLPVTKMKSSVVPVTTAPSNSSSHLMKQARTKQHHNFRWKTKTSNVARVNNYPDPMYSADSAFLQRITEMASLEVETIKFEKSKKLRRKWKNEN